MLTLHLNVFGNLIRYMVLFFGKSRQQAAAASVGIFVTTGLIIAVGSSAHIIHSIVSSVKSAESAELWLITASELLTTIAVLSYYTAIHLPSFLREYGTELNCDEECSSKAAMAGIFLLFLALITFTFTPAIFSRFNKVINPDYNQSFIAEERYKSLQVRWLIMHLPATTLHFNAIYAALWNTVALTTKGCGSTVIIGSVACILVGWLAWTLYATSHLHYLKRLREIIANFKMNHKRLALKHRLLEMSFYGTLLLLLLTGFPIYITSNNDLPLSCGCHNDTLTNTTLSSCNKGVLVTRVVLLSYQVNLLTTLAILALIKFNLKATKDI